MTACFGLHIVGLPPETPRLAEPCPQGPSRPLVALVLARGALPASLLRARGCPHWSPRPCGRQLASWARNLQCAKRERLRVAEIFKVWTARPRVLEGWLRGEGWWGQCGRKRARQSEMPCWSTVISSFWPRREDELFAAGARVLDRLLPLELNPRGLWVERQCLWWSHDHQDPYSRSGGTRHQRQRQPFLLAAEGNSFFR